MKKTTFTDLRRHYDIKERRLEGLFEAYRTPSSYKINIEQNLSDEIARLFKGYDLMKKGIYSKNCNYFTYVALAYNNTNCISLYVTYKKAVMIEETEKHFFIDYFDNVDGLLYYSHTTIVSRTDEP